MLFYAYGTGRETVPGPHGSPLDPYGTLVYPHGPHRIQMSPEARNSNAFLCIRDGTGKRRGSAWADMEPHWTPMGPNRIPPDPDEPRSKDFQCFSMHMGVHRKQFRVGVDPH